MGNHRVYITLNNNNLFSEFYCVPCHVQGIQDHIFFKQHCLRRIEILWLTVTQGATAEANHPTPHIPYGKDDTISKVIIDPATFTALPTIPPLAPRSRPHRFRCLPLLYTPALTSQAAAHQFMFVIAMVKQVTRQPVSVIGRITKAKSNHRLARNAATLQVSTSFRRLL